MHGRLLILLVLSGLPGIALADVSGCWINEGGNSVIELFRSGERMHGRVVGLEEPLFIEAEELGTPGAVRIDLNNPEPELRERALAGLQIVSDLQADGDAWVKGRIYDPQSGNTYSARAELDGDGHLRVRGYIGSPLFGRTTRWDPAARRAEDTARMLARARPYLPEGAPPPDC